MTSIDSSITLDRHAAAALDVADPLARFRAKFHLPISNDGNPLVYLCGHSLGLQPRATASLVNEELTAWQMRAVEGHFSGARPWLDYHEQFTAGLADLCGALPLEVVAMNSLSVNLHLMLISFYRPTPQRYRLLIERGAFPSDRYAVESQLRLHGFDPSDALIEVGPREGEDSVRHEDLCAVLEQHGASIATVLLPGVQYLTGQLFDIAALTQAAHRQGCVIGFDLAHAIGNVPLSLHDWGVDFAAWCSYKYLNSGPGAIGGAFVHERHARAFDLPRLAGWWGHDKRTRFQMPDHFTPLPGAEGWQLSNPSILASAPLLASLHLFQAAGLTALRSKSMQLTAYMESLLRATLADEITLLTPSDAAQRGSQLSLRLKSRARGSAVHHELTRRGVLCDWREPDVIRAAPVPLYNRFVDVWDFVQALSAAMKS